MNLRLAHRGPDDEGLYIAGPIALAFRRLSIIDLEGGHQPMKSLDGRAIIVMNGEIYNYHELRQELQGMGLSFATRSDTEVLLNGYCAWGDGVLDRLNGMFAFALWDLKLKRLLIARDRLGIKPLYYALDSHSLRFASEAKSLVRPGELIDPEALDGYLTYRYVPAPRTMWKAVRKLPPGHMIIADERQDPQIRPFWDVASLDTAPRPEDTTEALQELLEDIVKRQMVADVPVGAMLSGGIDSSTVVSLMTRFSKYPIETFSAGFNEYDQYNEFDDALRTARFFGTRHHTMRLGWKEHLETLPKFAWHLDEPVANFTGITFMHLCGLARSRVTVALSGQGSDEIFAGYDRYRAEAIAAAIPRTLRPGLAAVLRHSSHPRLVRAAGMVVAPSTLARLRAAAEIVPDAAKQALYHADFKAQLSQDRHDPMAEFAARLRQPEGLNAALALDTRFWLVDDLLNVCDKVSMAHGLELRVPFLDHRLVEFAMRLQQQEKMTNTRTKVILRRAVAPWLPSQTLAKKKMGFPAPVAQWLRGPMRSAMRDAVLDPSFGGGSWFDRSAIERLITDHDAGQDRSRPLFALLLLWHWENAFNKQKMALCANIE